MHTSIFIDSHPLQRWCHSLDGGTDLGKPSNANNPSLSGTGSEGSVCPVINSHGLVLQCLWTCECRSVWASCRRQQPHLGEQANRNLLNPPLWFCFSLQAKGSGESRGLEVAPLWCRCISVAAAQGDLRRAPERCFLTELENGCSWRWSEMVVSQEGFITILCCYSTACVVSCGWRAATWSWVGGGCSRYVHIWTTSSLAAMLQLYF